MGETRTEIQKAGDRERERERERESVSQSVSQSVRVIDKTKGIRKSEKSLRE